MPCETALELLNALLPHLNLFTQSCPQAPESCPVGSSLVWTVQGGAISRSSSAPEAEEASVLASLQGSVQLPALSCPDSLPHSAAGVSSHTNGHGARDCGCISSDPKLGGIKQPFTMLMGCVGQEYRENMVGMVDHWCL